MSAKLTGARGSAADLVAASAIEGAAYDTGGIILPDGFVYLRKIGKVRAAGLTLDELTEQVRKIRTIIENLGLTVATPDEARKRLGLKGGDKVAF